MSYNLDKLSVKKAIVPVTDVDAPTDFVIPTGGTEVTYRNYIASSVSNASANFQCNPPSPNTIIDRKIYYKHKLLITFKRNRLAGSANYVLGYGYQAPRDYPLSKNIRTMNVTLNNTQVSVPLSEIIGPLLHFQNWYSEYENNNLSMTPTYPDQSQTYSLEQSSRNPLATYAQQFGGLEPRGAFPFKILRNDSMDDAEPEAQIEIELCEPLFISPLVFKGNHKGLLGIQTMSVNLNYSARPQRVWSIDPDIAGGGVFVQDSGVAGQFKDIEVDFTEYKPELLFRYTTPSKLMKIPSVITYPYADIQRYVTEPGNGPIAPNVPTKLTSSNIQLQSIPEKVYICVREPENDRTVNTTDTYFRINDISINWSNRSGILASANQQQLYKMSQENGLNLSWTQFYGSDINKSKDEIYGGVGSILCLDMAKDIGLSDGECVGMLGTYNFFFNLTVENISKDAKKPAIYLIVVSNGTLNILDNTGVLQQGIVSMQDCLDSKDAPLVRYNDYNDYWGGSFLGDVGKVFREKIGPAARKATDFAKNIPISQVQDVAEISDRILKLFGAGYTKKQLKEMFGSSAVERVIPAGGARIAGSRIGGGKKVTKKSLQARLR